MKKIILALCTVFYFYSLNAHAILEAKSVAAMLTAIEGTTLVYKETGKMFGFDSIESCLFVSADFIVLKNYCFPKKDYPAKGYTIISSKFGMIDLYDEDFGNEIRKHDIQITTFPEPMQQYLKAPLTEATVESLNAIIKDIYYKFGAACWSTNFDYNTHEPVANCNVKGVTDFDVWAAETQAITNDKKAWNDLYDKVEAKLIQ